jgi:hypothetical protein
MGLIVDRMEKTANIWANTVSEKDGVKYYTFSEKALEAYTGKIVNSCVWGFGETRTEPSLTKYLNERLGIKNVE